MPETTSLNPPHLLRSAGELIRLRLLLAQRAFLEKPSAQITTGIALVLFVPAARQIGERAAMVVRSGEAAANPVAVLTATFCLLFVLYIAALCTGFGLLAEPVPAPVLRPLAVRPGVGLLADAVLSLLSLPTLAFGGALFTLVYALRGGLAAALLLFVLSLAVALLLTRLATLLGRYVRGRGALVVGGIVALLLVLFAGTVPTAALASVLDTNNGAPRKIVHLRGDPPPPPPPPLPVVLRYTPPGLAARAIVAGRQGQVAFPWLGILALLGGATAGATVLLERFLVRTEGESGSGGEARTRPSGASRNASALQVEWRLLLRNPAAHRRLREPATLLLVFAYAWIAPNLGADAARNLIDLAGMGSILYLLLWQTQLLCDRFGNEAGTAATLFGLPLPRTRLLLAKNGALFALLMAADGAGLTLLALVAGNPRLIPALLLALPALLGIGTALGNVVSVLSPFPIAKRGEKREREPDRSLVFTYGLFGVGVWLLFVPVQMLVQRWGIAGGIVGAVYVAGLYGASVLVAARLLTPEREREMVALLDGGGG